MACQPSVERAYTHTARKSIHFTKVFMDINGGLNSQATGYMVYTNLRTGRSGRSEGWPSASATRCPPTACHAGLGSAPSSLGSRNSRRRPWSTPQRSLLHTPSNAGTAVWRSRRSFWPGIEARLAPSLSLFLSPSLPLSQSCFYWAPDLFGLQDLDEGFHDCQKKRSGFPLPAYWETNGE